MQMMQPVGGGGDGGGGDSNAAANSARLMDMTVRKIEGKQKEHEKRMAQIDIKIQNALTDTQGLNEHLKNRLATIFKDITRTSNLRNEVTGKIEAFSKTLQVLSDHVHSVSNK